MEKISNQKLLKQNLILASLFVTSYEMLKTSVQDRIKGFLCSNSTLNSAGEIKFEISNDYKKEILERKIHNIDKIKYPEYHLFYSSCLWLKDNNVINQNEISQIELIRKHRNLITHNPLKLLIDDSININFSLIKKTHRILTKIDKWWIIEFEIPINPDFDIQEIKKSQVFSTTSVFLDYLMSVVDDEIKKDSA
jgi:hypothetical protein